tara:strand:- start:1011 stop:1454 length:444 start_codon:yes stop_codon:yes gene_type:complete
VQKLNLPSFQFRFKKDDQNRPCIFDSIRKKWLVFTPEEWVRQNWIRFIVEFLNYPEGIIQIESGLKVNENQRRSDVLIYKASEATVLIECKAPKIKISESTLSQALNYNQVYKAKYIVLSNGLSHKIFFVSEGEIKQLNELPKFEDL